MTPPRTIALRRAEFARALSLSTTDVRVLVALLVRACPRTGQAWRPVEEIAESLGLSHDLVRWTIEKLELEDFLDVEPGVLPGTYVIELGDILVRTAEPPENLPIEPKREV